MKTTSIPTGKTSLFFGAKQLTVLLAFMVLATMVHAQGDNYRGGTWDYSFRISQQLSFDVEGEGGSRIDVEDEWGFGFDFGYHYNPHMRVGMSFDYVSPDYTSVLIPEDTPSIPIHIDHEMDMFDIQVNFAYSFIDGPFTPYIKGGLGWTYVDTNIASGPPQIGCYWDPWWGYVCTTTQSSYSDWLFAYNVAFGFRWEVRDSLFLSASYQEQWLDFNGTPSVGKLHFEVGFNY